jgi:SAM-dependent methyltransferase
VNAARNSASNAGITGTENYYRRRAREYDTIYVKPERQPDLRELEATVADVFRGCDVLEVAAGTGYWTQFFADTADTVLSTDINDATLEVARHRRVWPSTVEFRTADAFDLSAVLGSFDAAFAGFFWSHLLPSQLDPFLTMLRNRLQPGARIVFIDNRYVTGSSTPISRTDSAGNTYQTRVLHDGSSWEVLKNFPTPEQLRDRLEPMAAKLEIIELEYFWIAELQTAATS